MKNKLLLMAAAILSAIIFTSCEKEKYINESGNLVPKTVDQDPSLPSITVNGSMLHSEAFGHPDSTMVVCIHGGPGSDYRYLLNCKDLVNYGYRVVFYDQRGSGLSQRFPKSSYTSIGTGALDVIYNELSAVIAHYRSSPNQKVFLIGHSWGAMLATAYSGKFPDSVQGMVLCEPGGLKWADVIEYVNNSRSFKLWSEFLNDATYLDQFISGDEDQHAILDYKLALLAGENENTGENNTEPGSFWRNGAIINSALIELGNELEPDFSTGISKYNVHVLFMYSEKNKAYPDTWAQKISGVYNSLEIFKVTGVGHDGIIKDNDAWEEITLPKILSYFDSL